MAVTGATGAIGPKVVEALLQRGARISVVGRDLRKLRQAFPVCKSFDWSDLEAAVDGAAAVIHLAVRNNDSRGSREEFRRDNVLLTTRVAEVARRAGALLVLASTFRAIDPKGNDHYGHSKEQAERALAQIADARAAIIRLPAIRTEKFAGRLKRLNVLPSSLRPLRLVGALRPEVAIEKAARVLAEAALDNTRFGDNVTIIEVFDDKDANGWYRGAKRAGDLIVATAILVLFWWLLAVVWLAVRASSPGPGLFIQPRVGRAGTVFRCYKFRTMVAGTRQDATHLVSRSSVTRLGRALRRWKVDELPQIVNLFNGTMTLVGPRPSLTSQIELIQVRSRLGVDALVPGITGYAQIRDIDMSDPERLGKADLEYIARRSLIADLRILLATIVGRGMADRTAVHPPIAAEES